LTFGAWFAMFVFAVLSVVFFSFAKHAKKLINRSEDYARYSRSFHFLDPFYLRLTGYLLLAAIPIRAIYDLSN
jgi:predicted Co/Zn/Cd cation transporter (cation efflux family)